MEQGIDQPVAGTRYAGFWIRTAAYLIDLAIAGTIAAVVTRLFFGGFYLSEVDGYRDGGAISLIVSWLYFAYQESSVKQATIGKLLVGIKVCSGKGARLTFANATGRYFAKMLSAILLLVGFIVVAFDEKKQGLHDKLAKTFVIYP